MKKILFVLADLEVGGIKTAFLNLINSLAVYNKYEIDVLIFSDRGGTQFPESVNIIQSNKYIELLNLSQAIVSKKSKMLGVLRYFFGGIAKFFGSNIVYKIVYSTYKNLHGYDCAISYAQSGHIKSLYGGMNEFVLNKVSADKKITFLHCDYELSGINNRYSRKIYKKFDKIAAVSKGVKQSFLRCLPELSNKVYVSHNFNHLDRIVELSKKETVSYNQDAINFITVARLSHEKGQWRVLKIFERLKEDGLCFHWHIVGGAELSIEDTFKDTVNKYGLSNNVELHGSQDNPYRYFPNADLLLVPSYHEAAPVVFAEAEILNVPVLSTNTISAQELVEERGIGYVCENTDDALYEMLKELIIRYDKTGSLGEFKKNTKEYSNDDALREFIELIQ